MPDVKHMSMEKLSGRERTMTDLVSVLGAPLISAGAAIVVSAIQNRKTVSIIDLKLEMLTKQVEKHNSVIERTGTLERKVAVVEQRLDDMKE